MRLLLLEDDPYGLLGFDRQAVVGVAPPRFQGALKNMPIVAVAFEFRFLGGSMGSVVGERFVTHPLVRKVVFTGSTEVGRRVMAGCAQQVKDFIESGCELPPDKMLADDLRMLSYDFTDKGRLRLDRPRLQRGLLGPELS